MRKRRGEVRRGEERRGEERRRERERARRKEREREKDGKRERERDIGRERREEQRSSSAGLPNHFQPVGQCRCRFAECVAKAFSGLSQGYDGFVLLQCQAAPRHVARFGEYVEVISEVAGRG